MARPQPNDTRSGLSSGQALAIVGGLIAIVAVIGTGLYIIGGIDQDKKKTKKKPAAKKASANHKR